MKSSLVRSFRYAFSGLAYLLRTQNNARIHAGISALVLAAGLWLNLSGLQWALIALAAGLVWTAEAFNTAVEGLVDLASPQINPTARIVKDLAAASVLLSAAMAALVGLLVLGPPLLQRVGGR